MGKMPNVFMRSVINSLMPKGALWSPSIGGNFARLLDGISKNKQTVLDDLACLSHLREPARIPIEMLPILERELGVAAIDMDIELRRAILRGIRYKNKSIPTCNKLQHALNVAGFGEGGYGVVVVENENPAINPGDYINPVNNEVSLKKSQAGSICARNPDGSDWKAWQECAGYNSVSYKNPNLPKGSTKYYYLLNTDNHSAIGLKKSQAGSICARNPDGSDWKAWQECAGYNSESNETYNKYSDPPCEYWPMVFFICAGVTRNEDGNIISISPAKVPAVLRQRLNRIVLRIKPEGIWAAMIVDFD